MTTRKKTAAPSKPAAKRARKTTKKKAGGSPDAPSPQPDLLGDVLPGEPISEGAGDGKTRASGTKGTPHMELDPSPEPVHPSRPPSDDTTVPAADGRPETAADSGQNSFSRAEPSWWLSTNHLNMLYMLAAGLVMGPAGFAGKHYRDSSSELPGLIPVFRGVCPAAAIQQSICEKSHLRPCIAEIDLAGAEGPAFLASADGVVALEALPLGGESDAHTLLVPAPLPAGRIRRVAFRTAADLKEFQAGAQSFANIDLTDLITEVDEKRFSEDVSAAWPLPEQPTGFAQMVDERPARGEAIGGVLAVLYQLANRSALGCAAYRIACGSDDPADLDAVQADPLLAEFGRWVETGEPNPGVSWRANLYWGAVAALVSAKLGGTGRSAVDVAIEFLESQISLAHSTDHQSWLKRLVSDMRSSFGLGGGTISQLFERHKGSFSRSFLLFCLRERCVDLLEFSHPDLADEDLLLAAVLFGVRDGWTGMPVELRAPDGLSRFVEHRMFEVEVARRDSRVSLSPIPARPVPLRELLMDKDGDWSKAISSSLAGTVARAGWSECIVSRIRVPLGQYRLSITESGAEIIFRGVAGTPVVEVDRTALLSKIAHWPPLPEELESELRAAVTVGA